MRNNINLITLSIAILITFLSCMEEKSESQEKQIQSKDSIIKIKVERPNLNISFLLDLSDRI